MNRINHKIALKKVTAAERYSPNVQNAYDMANKLINTGIEVGYLIGPVFSLNPQ